MNDVEIRGNSESGNIQNMGIVDDYRVEIENNPRALFGLSI